MSVTQAEERSEHGDSKVVEYALLVVLLAFLCLLSVAVFSGSATDGVPRGSAVVAAR
ncbi:MAG: hypothetical protein ACLGI2_07555 [Acidimicrobiia bacterium]|jgi:hypothetical protein